ncbi:MAG: S8 family serine peptidase [Phycisphaeraceae bacterium]|nr:S8 family serine peptidase [Phycisphaeraceae bacterium]
MPVSLRSFAPAALLLALFAHEGAVAADRADFTARVRWVKPANTTLTLHDEPGVIHVKFVDDLPVRLVEGALTDRDTGALDRARGVLDALPVARWARVHDVPEDRLVAMRAAAERRTRKGVADLTTEYFAFLEDGADAASVLDALNALDVVELASPNPRPTPPPLPPNFQNNQGYLNASPAGVDALHGWSTLGTRGEGVAVVDLEYTFNPNHADLPPVQIIGGPQVDPGFGPNHGTAVLGQLGAIENGWGVTGIVHNAQIAFASTYAGSVWNVGGAIINATNALNPGDVILIEQQMTGPNGGTAYVPIEWRAQWYNAVVTAVGNGMIVVMAAGNGNQNLDDPIFSQGNAGHWPFLPQNDSGAIIVGAGAAATGFSNSTTPRSRLSFSNYGSRVNLQGWGERVWTTGYGSAYSAEGPNLHYTATFNGTSSASPIVAGACALIQSFHKQRFSGAVLDCWEMRALLASTGLAQQSGVNPVSQNIGPLPDIAAAAATLAPLTPCPGDIDGDRVVNFADLNAVLDAFGQSGQGLAPDLNSSGVVDFADLNIVLTNFGGVCE